VDQSVTRYPFQRALHLARRSDYYAPISEHGDRLWRTSCAGHPSAPGRGNGTNSGRFLQGPYRGLPSIPDKLFRYSQVRWDPPLPGPYAFSVQTNLQVPGCSRHLAKDGAIACGIGLTSAARLTLISATIRTSLIGWRSQQQGGFTFTSVDPRSLRNSPLHTRDSTFLRRAYQGFRQAVGFNAENQARVTIPKRVWTILSWVAEDVVGDGRLASIRRFFWMDTRTYPDVRHHRCVGTARKLIAGRGQAPGFKGLEWRLNLSPFNDWRFRGHPGVINGKKKNFVFLAAHRGSMQHPAIMQSATRWISCPGTSSHVGQSNYVCSAKGRLNSTRL